VLDLLPLSQGTWNLRSLAEGLVYLKRWIFYANEPVPAVGRKKGNGKKKEKKEEKIKKNKK
jgi:hypothetical protein